MSGLRRTVLSLVGMGLTLAIVGCEKSGHKDIGTGGNMDLSSLGGEAAFKSTLYKFTQEQNCKMCHAATISPYFASADLNTAYGFAKQLVDFSAPDQSVFIKYAGNGHCGSAPCSNPANSEVVKNLLLQWANAEVGDGTTGIQKYTTAALPIPNPLASITAARPSVMRFELKTFGIPALNNALLEIEIQRANATNYRVNRIKIAGNTAAVRIQGVHVYVKPVGAAGIGVEDENQGSLWRTLDATAPVFARPANLPATPLTATPLSTTALAIQQQSTADAITIGIEAIQ